MSSDFAFDHFLFVEMRDHIFGLGLISLQYNALERAFKHVMEGYVDVTIADLLFDKASNEQRANAIRSLLKAIETDEAIAGHIDHLLKYFAVCSENRNVLVHSSESWVGGLPGEGAPPLQKPLKTGGARTFHIGLEDIKRVSTDMIDGLRYLLKVGDLIIDRRLGGPPTFLQTPPLPDRLSPHQPPATLQADTPQPRS
jgi:hypothetical protein